MHEAPIACLCMKLTAHEANIAIGASCIRPQFVKPGQVILKSYRNYVSSAKKKKCIVHK